jgi:hypothetical protein
VLIYGYCAACGHAQDRPRRKRGELSGPRAIRRPRPAAER